MTLLVFSLHIIIFKKKNQYVNKLQIKQDLIIRFMNQFINFKTNWKIL